MFIFCAALQCMNYWTRVLQISNYFSISCCRGMENLGLHEEELEKGTFLDPRKNARIDLIVLWSVWPMLVAILIDLT